MSSTDPTNISFGALGGDPAGLPELDTPAINIAEENSEADLANRANAAFESGDYKAATELYTEYAKLLASRGPSVDLGDAYWRAGRSMQFQTDFAGAIDAFTAAADLFAKLGNEQLEGGAKLEAEHSQRELGVFEDAEANLGEQISAAEVDGEPQALGDLHMRWAEFSMHAGAPYGTLHHLNLAARIFETAGANEALAGAIFNAGLVLQGLQQFQAAFTCLQYAGEKYHASDNPQAVRMCHFVMGQVAMAAGQLPLAVQVFSDLETAISDGDEVLNLANTRAQLAQVFAVIGDDKASKEKYDLAKQAYTLLGKQENIDELDRLMEAVKEQIANVAPDAQNPRMQSKGSQA